MGSPGKENIMCGFQVEREHQQSIQHLEQEEAGHKCKFQRLAIQNTKGRAVTDAQVDTESLWCCTFITGAAAKPKHMKDKELEQVTVDEYW